MKANILRLLIVICGSFSAVLCLFFAYYTIRLAYVNLVVSDAANHRSGGMLIGAIVFPLASLFFGITAYKLLKRWGRYPKNPK